MAYSKRIKLDVNNMMADCIGTNYGVDPASVDALCEQAKAAQKNVESMRGKEMLGWMNLPYSDEALIAGIEEEAARIRAQYDAFVVLGIGGSALGPIAVQQALNHYRWNELPREKRNGPKLYVEDNVDPERMASLLDVIDITKTCFNVITKSGATAETMSQYLIISELLKARVGDGWTSQMIATTDAESGTLLQIAKKEGIKTFFIPSSVGGRFSELSPVGLLAAAVCGIDIRAMLEGAKMIDQACQCGSVWDNPALLAATLQYICMTDKGINVHVMLPYADRLKSIADWFCQLWAESLGKNITRKGTAVNVGQTPVKSLGVTDQHSQLQLYTEGPYDKVITLLKVESFQETTRIPEGFKEYANLSFLSNRTHNELIDAELQGTEYALYQAGRLNQMIILPEVNAHTIGQLLYFFEMVTAYAGELLDIDAFNQPGVQESKDATYAVMGHQAKQYSDKLDQMKARPAKNGKYIL